MGMMIDDLGDDVTLEPNIQPLSLLQPHQKNDAALPKKCVPEVGLDAVPLDDGCSKEHHLCCITLATLPFLMF